MLLKILFANRKSDVSGSGAFCNLELQLNPDFLSSQGTEKVVRKIGGLKIEVQFNPGFPNSDKIVRNSGGSKN